ncbi:MAG: hypothetical protein P4L55_00805 [Syntrophobacteraceae bacterium]|nr:hypothetical protein [Syntrophobacteraceae bacterium]
MIKRFLPISCLGLIMTGLLLLSFVPTFIGEGWARSAGSDPLYDFLEGHYEIIGRWPDSNRTFTGKIVLRKSHDHLKVIRMIGGRKIEGSGTIETATMGEAKVLRIIFVQKDRTYEGTYVIGSDLDNYGRLSGHVYLKNGGTKRPGLEAFFVDHSR